MHTMWKGALSFGLVNVPVRMFAATESHDVSFRYLHQVCQTPIQYTRTCPTCDKAVDWDEIVRGYEYEPNRFVVFTDEEYKALSRSRAQTIDIESFVELSEIDPIYFDKTYYLAPETSGKKAYQLLQAAMTESGKIAVARTVIRSRETLACVRVGQGVLVLETLFWPDEVRQTRELPNIDATVSAEEKELSMAVTLINQLATHFDPAAYVDTGREETLARIRQKVEENQISTPAEPAAAKANIVDLMAALQESIRRTQPDPSTAKSKPRPAKRAAKKTS
ncbi:MAG: Ku protein [Alicyclobacillus sp.]|nr:Ku protein [Alicyclobacillus sp.]